MPDGGGFGAVCGIDQPGAAIRCIARIIFVIRPDTLERDSQIRCCGFRPSVAAVSYDRQDPGLRITPSIALKGAERPQECVLRDVLRSDRVPQKITRQIVSGIQVREDQLAKTPGESSL